MSDEPDPHEAFALLSDPTRYAIVETLVESAFGDGDVAVGFADLRRAVGVEDAGQFNYHLRKLRPRFVEKTEEGYRPRVSALSAVGAARGGRLRGGDEERETTLDAACFECDERLRASRRGSRFRVTCPEHGVVVQTMVSPLAVRERDVADLAGYVWRDLLRKVEKWLDGACIVCDGPVERTLPAGENGTGVAFACDECGLRSGVPLAMVVATRPAVVAHYYAHGRDVRAEFMPAFVDPEHTTVVSEEPYEADVVVPVDGDELVLRVDADLAVTER